MLLARITPANLITIRKPIWNGRKIGIAKHRAGIHNEIVINYKDKYGELLYPNHYYISGQKLLTYPKQQLKSGVVLYIVPIDDLETLERV